MRYDPKKRELTVSTNEALFNVMKMEAYSSTSRSASELHLVGDAIVSQLLSRQIEDMSEDLDDLVTEPFDVRHRDYPLLDEQGEPIPRLDIPMNTDIFSSLMALAGNQDVVLLFGTDEIREIRQLAWYYAARRGEFERRVFDMDRAVVIGDVDEMGVPYCEEDVKDAEEDLVLALACEELLQLTET